MPLFHDELLGFRGYGGTPSRCRVRLFTPSNKAQESAATLAGNLSPTLGRPGWKHIDRDTVEILVGEPLP